jgi:O-antigen/teichoic acid export membrane protein
MIFNLLKDGMLNALSQGLYRFSILLLFFLHVKQFGDNALYTTIIMILLTFQSLGTAGLSMAAITFTSKFEEKYSYLKNIIGVSFFLAIVFAVIFYFSCELILENILKKNYYVSNVEKIYFSFSVFLLCCTSVIKGFYYAFNKNHLIFVASLSAVFFLLVLFFINNNLLYSYLASVIVEFLVLSIFFIGFLDFTKFWKSKYEYSKFKEILRFIIPSFLSSFFLMPVNIVVLGFIGGFYGEKIVNLYNLGLQIRNALIFLPSSFSPILLKITSSSVIGQGERKTVHTLYVLYSLITMFSIFLLLIVKQIMVDYFKIIGFMDIVFLGVGALFCSLTMVNFNSDLSNLRVNFVFFCNVFWGAACILTSYIFYGFLSYNLFIPLALSYIFLFVFQFIFGINNEANSN